LKNIALKTGGKDLWSTMMVQWL